MSFSAYGSNKRDYGSTFDTTSLTDKSVDGNFKTLKVNDVSVVTNVSGKLDSSALTTKTLDGNFATLKVMDANVITDVSGKLDSSALTTKTLNGNFATLKVMDTNVITDVSGKLDKIGGTMTGPLTLTTPTYTATQVGNATTTNTLGAIATGFNSVPPAGDYTLTIGVYNSGTTTPNTVWTGYGTVSITSSNAYVNLIITSKGASVTSVTISTSSLTLTTATAVANTLTCFVWLTPISLVASTGVKCSLASGTLDIYGAGTAVNSRSIKLWDNVTVPGTMDVGGFLNIPGTTNGSVSGAIHMGSDVAGKNIYAGRIFYNTSSGFLDIAGVGTTASNRKIKLWDNVTVPGTMDVGSVINIPSTTDATICINMGSELTKGTYAGRIYYHPTSGPGSIPMLEIWGGATGANAKTIKLWENVIVSGTLTTGGLLTLNTAGLSASNTTYTAANVKSSLDLGVSGGTMGGLLTLNTTGLSADGTTFTATQVKTALNNGSGTFSSDLTMSADKKIILPTSYTTAPTTLQLGGVDSGSVTAFNLTSGTTKSFGPFSTTNPGSYIVVATFLFNSGTYTQLKVGISTSTSFSTNYVSDGATNSAMTTSASNYISRQVTDFLSNTTASTFYLIVQGTFTGTGTVFPSFQLMRIA